MVKRKFGNLFFRVRNNVRQYRLQIPFHSFNRGSVKHFLVVLGRSFYFIASFFHGDVEIVFCHVEYSKIGKRETRARNVEAFPKRPDIWRIKHHLKQRRTAHAPFDAESVQQHFKWQLVMFVSIQYHFFYPAQKEGKSGITANVSPKRKQVPEKSY